MPVKGNNLILNAPNGEEISLSPLEIIAGVNLISHNGTCPASKAKDTGIAEALLLAEVTADMPFVDKRRMPPQGEKAKIVAGLKNASSVYFVTCENSGLIKIGHTKNLKKRLGSLQIGSASKLSLITATTFRPELEKFIHKHLESEHVRGEWFNPSEKTLSVIETLINKGLPALIKDMGVPNYYAA